MCAGDKPTLHQLHSLNIGPESLRLIQKLSARWRNLAYALEFHDDVVDIIKHDTQQLGCEESCHQTFCRWLGGEGCQPITWGRLIEALRDAEHAELAAQLQHFFLHST